MNALGSAKEYSLAIASFAVGLVLWQVIVTVLHVPEFLFPSPTEVWQAFFSNHINWLEETWITLSEALEGFFIGVAIGFGLAVLVAISRTLSRILMPYIVVLQVLPKVAIAPIIYILLGFSDISRVLLVVILTFFPIVINTSTGLIDVDRNLVHLMQSLGANRLTIFYKIRLQNSLPYFFDGLKIGVSGALVGAIVAEFVSSNSGLGFLILNSQYTFNTVLAFGAFSVLTITGLLLYAAVILLARVVMPWWRT